MADYPGNLVPVDHIEPSPRRIRATLGGQTVVDTTHALYVWEVTYYPQYYVPVADVAAGALIDEGREQRLKRGTARRHGIAVGGETRPGSAHVYGADALAGLDGYVRFEWDALDAWYEEDQLLHVHPRNPYTRVDAVRSSRTVRVELEGVVLAESSSPVMLFETGLPPRHYLSQTDVDFTHLEPSETKTSCPYKGTTSAYWSVRVGTELHEDLAWRYDFPTDEVDPIAGLVAFYDEKVDTFIDGIRTERPSTHFG